MEKRRVELLQGMEKSFFLYYSEVYFNQGLLLSHTSFTLIFLECMSWRQLEGHLGWASQGTVPAAYLVLLVDGTPMAGTSV